MNIHEIAMMVNLGHHCVRNGIKIVKRESKKHPKLAQKWPETAIFVFLKTCHYDSNEVFPNHSTPY